MKQPPVPAGDALAGSASGHDAPLGQVTIARFLQRHWQRRPLLVRGALPAGSLDAMFPIRDLFALAADRDVESRLIRAPAAGDTRPGGTRPGGTTPGKPGGPDSWRLQPGPLARLPARRTPGWTVLVQGVDLHRAAGRALLDRFRFVPDARIDDLMLSHASDGGGVGPHVDSYDVFLLQIRGRRRWRIAPPRRDAPWQLRPDQPIRVLADFTPTEDWLLDPGDMLYLPPGWAHEGTAVGECTTASIGFRSPTPRELRQAFFAALADEEEPADRRRATADRRYRDHQRTPATHPARIPDEMATTLADWLRRPPSHDTIERFIGRFLTEPKPNVWFDGDDSGSDRAGGGSDRRRAPDARPAGLGLDRRTRMLYRGARVFINGEALTPPRTALGWLQRLADHRALDRRETAAARRDRWLRTLFDDWCSAGWAHPAPVPRPDRPR
ncbi:MAG: cupin domain-containing protein [Lautropia sp.]